MENDNLKLGGNHLKACKCCGIKFYGRRNQKFINKTHKASFNNEKAALKREKLNPVFKRILTTYTVLQNIGKREQMDKWLNVTDLIKEGFDPNIPTNRIKSKKDGTEYYKLLEFAFRLSENGTKIIIHQLKA